MNTEIEKQVLSAMRRLIRATDLESKELAKQTHLSPSQLLVMESLATANGLKIGQIAERVGLAQATITNMIDRLEQRQLVARRRSETDRREVIVTLTNAGQKLAATAPTALQTRFLKNFSGLRDWEKTAILSSLQRLADLMEAEDLDASPVLDVGTIA